MTGQTHETLVSAQFGPRASSYVTSPVHAQGADLDRLALLAKTKAKEGEGFGRVLDLGCGGGHASFTLAPYVKEVVAYDLSAEMLAAVSEEARKRGVHAIVTRQGKVEELPFQDGEFDLVVSRNSAHHWHDFGAALREARRVLKHDGGAVFMDAVSPGPALFDTYLQTVEMLRDPSHVRDYSIAEWCQALSEAGFQPGTVVAGRVRLDFAAWIERMATPQALATAIRDLQRRMPEEIRAHFEIAPDGSFTLDTMYWATG